MHEQRLLTLAILVCITVVLGSCRDRDADQTRTADESELSRSSPASRGEPGNLSVGALSAFNAIGSAYAENLPVILISGAPNTSDRATEHLLHHTLGTYDFNYQLEIAKKLTSAAVSQ